MSSQAETFSFQADVQQLLDLMAHSIYSNKDIFLRELISNASDALDKRRFEAVSAPELLGADEELHILLEIDAEARTLTIRDNGIGMTREEVIGLIGAIGKSGSREFLRAAQRAKETSPELIGQFGVGFYSAFMAAETVSLTTRRAGTDSATRWESSGGGTYVLESAERAEPGTDVTLRLKAADPEDGLHDYADRWTIQSIVKRYSDFVAYPIRLSVLPAKEDDPAPEVLNSMKAIWLRSKDEVAPEELTEFYKHISHDWEEPLQSIRAKIEGTLEYQVLLYIPKRAPFDLFAREGQHGVHLYVKRVFIMDDCKVLLPTWLRFMRGVVDSEDLSLNISREILQQDRQIQRMRKGISGKVLETLSQMKANDAEKYRTFWREFGRVLKEGLYQDSDHRDALLKLLLCESTSGTELSSLDEYVSRIKEGQSEIYYLAGESRKVVEASPHLEAFREKGYEVLIFTDPVDLLWVQYVTEYQGKPFKSIDKGALSLGDEEEKKATESALKEKGEEFGSLLAALQSALASQVKEVRLSNRLTTSPACLVSEEGGLSPQLEQLLRAAQQEVPASPRILELNPTHPLLVRLRERYAGDAEAVKIPECAELLYGQALLAEGGVLADPARFAKLVTDLMLEAI